MSRPVYVQEFPTPPTVGEVIELTGDEGRHAVSVKRTSVGEQIELVDGHGTRAVITVTGVFGKDRLTGVVDCAANEPASRPTRLCRKLPDPNSRSICSPRRART